jgi:hypothetical protein
MILAATDRGTFMARDEMAGLFEFGRYTKNTGAAERAFYLQAYEGGHYTVSRVSRDSLHIAVNALTIYGSIQPDRLKDFPDLAKDGLVQRINMVRASPASASRDNVTVNGVERSTQQSQPLRPTRHSAMDHTRRRQHHPTDRTRRPQLRHHRRLRSRLSGHLAQLHGTHARWAPSSIRSDNPGSELIPQTTVERAAILNREFPLPQARDFFLQPLPAHTATPPRRRRMDPDLELPCAFLASNPSPAPGLKLSRHQHKGDP